MLIVLFHAWRDFFIVAATTAATLIGAMFVVVSIAVGILSRERSVAAHAYLTSTLVHLGAVLLASLATMAPAMTWLSFGAVLTVGGLVGLVYVATLAATVHRFSVDWTDVLWYTVLPLAGYAGFVAAGVLSFMASLLSVPMLGAAAVLVLICGVHNAWDMILAFAMRAKPTPRDDRPL